MTRLERRMRDALEGNEREVLEKYNREIAQERKRKAHSPNPRPFQRGNRILSCRRFR